MHAMRPDQSMPVDLEMGICTVSLCGSDEWQIAPNDE